MATITQRRLDAVRSENFKLRQERDAAVAALRDLFEHCSMIHNKWGEGCNQKQADAAIQQARAVIAASQGSAK